MPITGYSFIQLCEREQRRVITLAEGLIRQQKVSVLINVVDSPKLQATALLRCYSGFIVNSPSKTFIMMYIYDVEHVINYLTQGIQII